MSSLLKYTDVALSGLDAHVEVNSRYGNSNLHFVDCLLVATAARTQIPTATFDREYRKFSDAQVDFDRLDTVL